MNDTAVGEKAGTDYSATLFLPETDFPMRAGLPEREPIWLQRWEELDLYARQREQAAARPLFTLHDGPPYANGNIHIGHALNKTLKDLVSRSMQMLGYNSAYVPGWDCHGLPIEWKVEEEYRAKGKNKDEVEIVEFRAECRSFAQHWIDVQREEFKRLGVIGDWNNPYLTMSFAAEAQIARELMKFAVTGQLYRGSKPVMWSVVERTALAEAEIEYQDYESDTIWVKFPIHSGNGAFGTPDFEDLNAFVVIWTTTPWTIPANRAISYSSRIAYGLYEVTRAPEGNWAAIGEKYVLADKLAAETFAKAKVEEFTRLADVDVSKIVSCAHPLRGLGGGYEFEVPLLDGEHVTDDAGTGFVHTAPGHGLDDFEIWMNSSRLLQSLGIDTSIPFVVDDAGFYTSAAPGFEGARIIDDNGKKGDANQRVIAALAERGMMVARSRVKHQYPHSWRSKKPVIFRNTPQWFVYMDRPIATAPSSGADAPTSPPEGEVKEGAGHLSLGGEVGLRSNPGEGAFSAALPDTLRNRALHAIDVTKFYPPAGQNRLRSMIAERPDWVLSRQRAWGVPIAVFVHRETGEILLDEQVNHRIGQAFEEEGADAWFKPGAAERFLGAAYNAADWEKVDDILDVWFESGTTHSWVLRNKQKWPWLNFPADMYLEGSDQHRGWFHSSLLESCATNGFAPYRSVLTHGFTLDGEGRKMSKSLGNTIAPQDVIKQYGADILRLWAASTDYSEDQRIGKEILQTTVDAYRKLRNTLRWMLGNLAHFTPETVTPVEQMAELDRLMLSRLKALEKTVVGAYRGYDYKRVVAAISNFAANDLSAFYFDIRKDALYCDPISSVKRKGALTAVEYIFDALVKWMAPILAFTAEETWLSRHGDAVSVHLELFPTLPDAWFDEALEARWERIARVRRVVTGALEIERREKRIGSSLEAAPKVYIGDGDLLAALEGIDFAEVCITSGIEVIPGNGPAEAFRLAEISGVAVVPALAEGRRCARSWKILPEVGSDPDYPDLSLRDAQAMRERKAAGLDA
ncbi:MAG TPA: isoleucine--tRNA ligase [Devosia sp.]|nr:isoleucine--tRNA ligase [Devosia sp.]